MSELTPIERLMEEAATLQRKAATLKHEVPYMSEDDERTLKAWADRIHEINEDIPEF